MELSFPALSFPAKQAVQRVKKKSKERKTDCAVHCCIMAPGTNQKRIAQLRVSTPFMPVGMAVMTNT
jgi:hypothetical protein